MTLAQLSNFPRGMMSLCLETAYLVLKNVRQPLLPHHHVTAPVCQLIYVSLQNLTNEVAPPTAVSPGGRPAPPLPPDHRRMWGGARARTKEDVHREASLNLMSLVRSYTRHVPRAQRLLSCLPAATMAAV